MNVNSFSIKDVYKYPNYWFVVGFHLLGTSIGCLLISGIYFVTNNGLRRAVTREASQFMWNLYKSIKMFHKKVLK